jgi:ketosteroid isomerase-like protein
MTQGGRTMSTSNEDVAAFLSEWTVAEQHGDTAVLDRSLVDDFVGVGPLGFLLSKQDWLARFAGGLQYDEFSLDDTHVRSYGDTALVIGQQNQRGSHQGNPIPEAARTTLVLVNRSVGWRLASIHMSFVAGTPGAPPGPGR